MTSVRWAGLEAIRGAGVSDGNAYPAGAHSGRTGLGLGWRDRIQDRREPGLGVAPDGEAPGAGLRSSRPGGPAATGFSPPEEAACRPDRPQLKVRPRGFSLVVLDEVDSTNDEAARQLAAGRQRPLRGPRPAADPGPRPVWPALAQRGQRQPLRELCLPSPRRPEPDADLHALDGGQRSAS